MIFKLNATYYILDIWKQSKINIGLMVLCNAHIICNTLNAPLIESFTNVFPNFVCYAHHCLTSTSQMTMFFCPCDVGESKWNI
jgi:hypothetical protein